MPQSRYNVMSFKPNKLEKQATYANYTAHIYQNAIHNQTASLFSDHSCTEMTVSLVLPWIIYGSKQACLDDGPTTYTTTLGTACFLLLTVCRVFSRLAATLASPLCYHSSPLASNTVYTCLVCWSEASQVSYRHPCWALNYGAAFEPCPSEVSPAESIAFSNTF